MRLDHPAAALRNGSVSSAASFANSVMTATTASSRSTTPTPHQQKCCPSCGSRISSISRKYDDDSDDDASISGSSFTGTDADTSSSTTTPDLSDPKTSHHQHWSSSPKSSPLIALSAAHRRIAELESQVRLLSQKATAAVDRWADYEDEIARLRSEARQQQTLQEEQDRRRRLMGGLHPSSPHEPPYARPQTSSGVFAPPSPTPSRTSFFSSLLSPRRSMAALRPGSSDDSPASPPRPSGPLHPPSPHTLAPPRTPPPPPENLRNDPKTNIHAFFPHPNPIARSLPPSPSPSASAEVELLEALTREQTLRHAAEGRLNATSREVEELSAALFEQANEMVADERRARAALAERVEILERRDVDKNKRLERLESAMARIQSARAVLAGHVDKTRVVVTPAEA